MELRILDWLQSFRTPVGDVIMPLITRLGDAGSIWILLTIILLLVPKTRKSGMILAAALCVDVILCNGILKNLVARIRPCDVNHSVQLLIVRPDDFSFPRVIRRRLLRQFRRFFWLEKRNYGNWFYRSRFCLHFQGCTYMYIIQRIFWAESLSE